MLPAEELALFDAWLLMLGGDSLVGETVERIRAGNWAQGALRETIGEHVRVFEAMEDSYLRERASDIRDLGRRILTHLQSDRPSPGMIYPQTVLVGEDISAGQLAGDSAGKSRGYRFRQWFQFISRGNPCPGAGGSGGHGCAAISR